MAEESGKERRKDGLVNVLVVAVCVCLVCSVIVSTAAVALKPRQLANQALDRKQNILRAAGLLPADSNLSEDGRSVDELFAQFTVRAVDLETGRYIDGVDPATYDPVKAAKDPEQSTDLEDDRRRSGGAKTSRCVTCSRTRRAWTKLFCRCGVMASGAPSSGTSRWTAMRKPLPDLVTTHTKKRPVSAVRWTIRAGRRSGRRATHERRR